MITAQPQIAGLGDNRAGIAVYLANRPPMAEYAGLSGVQPLHSGEIALINQSCGNGWRKVFNVYAKLLFALDCRQYSFQQQAGSWQAYRDTRLLQAGSGTALLFSAPSLSVHSKAIQIIAGRSHAKALINAGLPAQLHWLNHEFAIDHQLRLLVCPYFDYRQLNNEKINFLSNLISELNHASVS
jgi:hypothetical protein